MSQAFLGPYPNVAVTVSVTVGGQTTTRTVNVPDTSVFNVTQQAALTQAPTDLRTAQRSLTFAEDPRMEVREADYPGYTVSIIERVIQEETAPDNWAVIDPTATSAIGAQVRFRARVQVYDEIGAIYEGPVDLYSEPQTVIAHVAPGNMAVDSIALTSITSPSATEAQADILAYPAAGSALVTGFDYSIDGGATTAGTVLKAVGSTVILTLAASTADQVVHVRARDADGGTSAAWTQLTDTASTSVGAEQITITPSRTTGIAPCGVSFQVTATGFGVEEPFKDIRYRWTFGDPGHYTRMDADMFWDRVYDVDGVTKIVRGPEIYAADGETLLETQAVAPAVPTGTSVTFLGNDKDLAYGPIVCHVWDTPGTYTVTVEALTRQMVIDGRLPISKTVTVTVTDMFATVTTARRAYIKGGAAAGAEPNGALVFNTYADAFAALRESTAATAVLFRRGQSHAVDKSLSWGNNKPLVNIAAAYGPEADGDPVLNFPPDNLAIQKVAGTERIFTGLKLAGPFDSTDPYSPKPPDGFKIDNRWGGHVTLWDFDMSGYYKCFESTQMSDRMVFGNGRVSSWMDYGFFLGGGTAKTGLCGMTIQQPHGTVTGEGKSTSETNPLYANHGPFRSSQIRDGISFNLVDARSLNSWSTGGGFQPTIRIGGSDEVAGDYSEQAQASLDRVRSEIGTCIGSGVYPGNLAYAKKQVYDKVYVAMAHNSGSGSIMHFGAPGLDIRNIVATIIDMPQFGGGISNWISRALNDPLDPDALNYGIDIYSSTFVDQRRSAYSTTAMGIEYENFADWAFFRVSNSVFEVPNRTNASWPSNAPLGSDVLYTVAYDGLRFEAEPFDPSYASPADTAQSFNPEPGSIAYQSADLNLRVAVDDMWGRVRPAAGVSKGAMEPY